MSLEEFQRYWREVHAPIVAERAETLGIKRYVHVHTRVPEVNAALQARNDGSPEPYDGVAEIWVESLEAMSSEDPAIQKTAADLLSDERNFIDLQRSPIWIAEEQVILS
jgi:uncharacterized protein (TIGR02118 family)